MLNFNTLNVILFILPVYQTLFYTVQLITLRKSNDPSRRPLGLLMLLMLIYLSISASRHLGYVDLYNYLYIFQIPVLLAILPTYYFYLQVITNKKVTPSKRSGIIYYLPSAFILLLNIIDFFNMGPAQTNELLISGGAINNGDNAMSFTTLALLLGNVGFVAFQLIAIPIYYFKLMRQLIISRKDNPTFLPHFEIKWAQIIFGSVLVFVLLCGVMNLLNPRFESFLPAILNLGILAASGLSGFLSLKQDKLFIEVESIPKNQHSEDKVDTKSAKSAVEDVKSLNGEIVDAKEAQEIIAALENHLVIDKPYLDNNLRSIDLARKIGTSKQKLTYVINNIMDTNFYGIINKYRVIEAKTLLSKPESKVYNIDAIMEMSGFQSKSSFNGCFKKMTGQTPSEYRKKNGK